MASIKFTMHLRYTRRPTRTCRWRNRSTRIMHIHAPWLDTAMVGYLNSLLNSFPSRIYGQEEPGKLVRSCHYNDILSRVSGIRCVFYSNFLDNRCHFCPHERNWFPIILKTKSRYCILTRKWNANVEAIRAFVDDDETHMRLDNDLLARIRRDRFIFNFFATCSFEIREEGGGGERSCGVRE